MALAVVLLAGAGVMIRSFLKIHTANVGARTENVLVVLLTMPAGTSAPGQIAFFDRLKGRLETVPGVESIVMADSLPTWGSHHIPYELAGAQPMDASGRPRLSTLVVSPAYFTTLGAALLSGRDFTDRDGVSGVPVAIVNQRFAAKFWPGGDAVGKRLRLFAGKTPEPWLTVVGVASNIIQDDATRQEFGPVIYLPYRQNPEAAMWILARTRVPPQNLANAFRREIHIVNSDLPIYGPYTLGARLEGYWDSRFYGFLFLIFAAIALLLASIGLYAVIAHSVSQRTQEIGVRTALGATASDILKLVVREGMLPVGVGLAVGLAASLGVNQVLKSQLVNISPSDPVTLVVASACLILSAALGCLIPARRAMRVDPVVALRHE
jgi:predicted permease